MIVDPFDFEEKKKFSMDEVIAKYLKANSERGRAPITENLVENVEGLDFLKEEDKDGEEKKASDQN